MTYDAGARLRRRWARRLLIVTFSLIAGTVGISAVIIGSTA